MTSAKFLPHDMRPTDGTYAHKACVSCGRTLAEAQQIVKHDSLMVDNCPGHFPGESITQWDSIAERSLLGSQRPMSLVGAS